MILSEQVSDFPKGDYIAIVREATRSCQECISVGWRAARVTYRFRCITEGQEISRSVGIFHDRYVEGTFFLTFPCRASVSLTSPSGEFVPRVESPRRQSHELVLPVTLAAPEQVPRLGRCHMVDDLWRKLSLSERAHFCFESSVAGHPRQKTWGFFLTDGLRYLIQCT